MGTYDDSHDRRALDAIAKDMGLHDGANRDAALGLEPERFDEMTGPIGHVLPGGYVMKPHDGTTPGPAPSRTDAASLSDLVSRREACRVVESAAWNALLESGLTREQLVLLGAYNDSIHATRKAELDMHYAMFAKGGSL